MVSQNGISCISSLWRKYSQTKDLALRNKLVEAYISSVKYIAEGIKARLPESVELDDLISAGVFGLIDAVEAFDLARGIKFETYCIPRIRGAILDELRNMDWVPRLVRSRVKKYDLAHKALSNGNGHVPTLQEIADYLEVTVQEAERIQAEGSAPVVHFCDIVDDQKGDKKGSDHVSYNMLADQKALDPEHEASKEDGFNDLILCLNPEEQIIITLYHRDEWQMWKIGRLLGMSESRVSQMHSRALQRIKDSRSF